MLLTNKVLVVVILLVPLLHSCKLLDNKLFNKEKITSKEKLATPLSSPDIIIERSTAIPYDKTISMTKYETPFDIINERANMLLSNWTLRPSELPDFTEKKPIKPLTPPSLLLTKREFETTEEFQKQVQLKEQEKTIEIKTLEDKYQDAVNKYNSNIRAYNEALSEEKRLRDKESEKKYWEFVNATLPSILGDPVIKLVEYNADKQFFYSILGSTKSNLTQWIVIEVPVEKAKLLRKNKNDVLPILELKRNSNNDLVIKKIYISVGANSYIARLTNKPIINSYERVVRSKPINVVDNYLKINKGNKK